MIARQGTPTSGLTCRALTSAMPRSFVSNMQNIVTAVVTLALSLSVTGYADTSFYKYALAGYPIGQGTTCEQTANEVAARLTKVSGVPIYQTQCGYRRPSGQDIEITYVAEKPLSVETTLDTTYTELSGNYRSLDECQLDLENQVTLFQIQTKLVPWISYCYSEGGPAGGYPVSSWIDGVGVSSIHLNDETMELGWDVRLSDPQSVVTQVGRLLTPHQVSVSRIFITDNGPLGNNLHVQYYASRHNVQLRDWKRLQFRSEELCLRQFAEATEIFRAAQGEDPVLVCAAELNDYSYWLHAVTFHPFTLRVSVAPKVYPTFQQCLDAKSQTIADYKNLLHWNVAGALCDRRAGESQTYVFGTN